MNNEEDNGGFSKIGDLVAEAITRLEDRPRRCFIEEGHIVFRDGAGYSIPLAACDSYDRILQWQLQLSEKQWMSLDLLMQFTLMVCDHHGLAIRR
jgi:hypothetical protein